MSSTIVSKYHLGILPLLFAAIIMVIAYSELSLSVLFVILITVIGILLGSNRLKGEEKRKCRQLMFTVLAVYLFSSILFSYSFEDGTYFSTPDALQYFRHLKMTKLDIEPSLGFLSCYVLFDDANFLHELFVRYCIIFANNYLDGASIIYLTLINVFFGVLTVGLIFRIVLKVTDSSKAYKYVLLIALLSPIHFYSVSVVRDIIVAFFYAWSLILAMDEHFKLKNLLFLIFFVLIVWGIRLYSGLFIVAFIGYYIFSTLISKKSSRIPVIIALILVLLIGVSFFSQTDILEQSSDELENYVEYNQGRESSSSLTAKLDALPPIVREFSLGTYSLIMPFPFYDQMRYAKSIDEVYISSLVGVYAIYQYFLVLGFLYMLVLGRGNKSLSIRDWILIAIFAIYIVLNLAHPDTRRIMAVLPILLIYYIKMKEDPITHKVTHNMNQVLGLSYVFLFIVYTALK